MNRTKETALRHEAAFEELNKKLTQPAEHYASPRIEGEIDLVQEVRQRLIDSGLLGKIQAYDFNRYIQEAQGKTSHAQQYNLNRWLNLQLMAVPQDTSVQRYALIYEINAAEWLSIFDRVILPALIDFDLPVVIA